MININLNSAVAILNSIQLTKLSYSEKYLISYKALRFFLIRFLNQAIALIVNALLRIIIVVKMVDYK